MSEDKCESLTDPLFHQYHIVLLQESILTREGSTNIQSISLIKDEKGKKKIKKFNDGNNVRHRVAKSLA